VEGGALTSKSCVFCAIVAREEPATIRYEDDEIIAFDNVLHWAPVMVLVIPKRHMSQEEMWRDMGRVGQVAIQLGNELSPRGFRLLSNFGPNALQSQSHSHVHVVGGRFLGPYV
jgi:histidine triad (HIT) family protein